MSIEKFFQSNKLIKVYIKKWTSGFKSVFNYLIYYPYTLLKLAALKLVEAHGGKQLIGGELMGGDIQHFELIKKILKKD